MPIHSVIAILFVFLLAPGFVALQDERRGEPRADPADVRLPNGKLQKDEILKADHQKNIEDAAKLAKLSDGLRSALEKSDQNVLSIDLLKQTEEIEKIARRIRARMKKF
jgi:hypothetical protein